MQIVVFPIWSSDLPLPESPDLQKTSPARQELLPSRELQSFACPLPSAPRSRTLGGRVFSSHTPSSKEVRFGCRARQHMSALFFVPLKTIPGGRGEVKAPLLPGQPRGGDQRQHRRPQPRHPPCSRPVPLGLGGSTQARWERCHLAPPSALPTSGTSPHLIS